MSINIYKSSRDVNTGFLGKPVFSCLKLILNRFSALLASIEIYISSPVKSGNIWFLCRPYYY